MCLVQQKLSLRFMMFTILLTICVFQVSIGLPVVKLSSVNDHTDAKDVSMSATEESRKSGELHGDLEKRSAMEGQMVDENTTAGNLIYKINKDLPSALSNMIVDMDIAIGAGVTYNEDGTVNVSKMKRAVVNRRNPFQRYRIWRDGRVPYAFDPFVSHAVRANVTKAMNLWMDHTCIRFVPRTSQDRNYLHLTELPGCWSYVGNQRRGPQKLSLGAHSQTFCKHVGVLLHELGHAIGFYHEQCRPDRDRYITVHWENIIEEAKEYFWAWSPNYVDNFSVPYDYHSIMHYPEIAFSVNGEPTLEAKQPGVSFMGQRNKLSPLDIKQANLLYNCRVSRNNTIIHRNKNTWDIPSEAFLIQNHITHTCLTLSRAPSHGRGQDTRLHRHRYQYLVTLTVCNSSLYEQYWQWNGNNSILHLGTLLCLTSMVVSNADGSETDHLVLAVCSDEEISNQTWSCAGKFIQQPDTGKCITAHSTSNHSSDDVELELLSAARRRKKRELTLDDIAEELGQFLQDLEEYDDEETMDSGTRNETEMSQSDYQWNETTVSMSYCDSENHFQVWSAIQLKQVDDTESALNETKHTETETETEDSYNDTICSSPSTSSHRLPQCYAQSISTNLHLPTTWTTCRHIGYYVASFYHIQSNTDDSEGQITGLRCCGTSVVFMGDFESPPSDHSEVCSDVDWWNYQDALVSKGWSLCPRGMFLKGLNHSMNDDGNHVIKKAKCCRPATSPVVYEHCYTEHAQNILDTKVHGCGLQGYQVTGIYKKRSRKGDGKYVEEVTCCMHV